VPETVTEVESVARAVLRLGLPEDRAPIVGVSGFGGSGKSTLAEALRHQLPGSVVVPGDEFLRERPPAERSDDWSSVDRERLVRQVLAPAHQDGTVRYQVLGPRAGALGPWVEVSGASALIVEGLGLYVPELVGLFDLRVWIDVDLDTATARGRWRDKHDYDNEQADLWTGVWAPNDRAFFERFRPDRSADLLFSGH
jgi:uridine kinase